jgi:DNA-binding SARP family transcriptional activator/WD40 repeat protein
MTDRVGRSGVTDMAGSAVGRTVDCRPRYRREVRFGVLGPLSVLDDTGAPVRLGGPARRRLLAALLARVGQAVSADTLIDDLWGDTPPATAEKTLQSHVVRLRDDLGRSGGSPVLTEATGYRLVAAADTVDAWCFERDLRAGQAALAAGDARAAVAALDSALRQWRGEAYAEFVDAAFAVSERLRLAELHALCLEARTDAELALGAGPDLVPDLEARVQRDPYRERSWEQLVIALYRGGRQRDALLAYQRARDRLLEDLGIEPSPSLRALEARVLDQDASLLVASPTAGQPRMIDVSDPVRRGELGPCPYRGLAAYDEADAVLFVGRERLTAELAGRLVDNDLLVVVGPSGAGKSSLVRAGLVPALRGGAIPGSSAWRIRATTPGRDPLGALDDAPADLLVIDQAEELFTITAPGDLGAVGRRLTGLLASGTRVVLVLRADFYGRLAELEVLTGRIGSATVLVGPMTEDEIRRVITVPTAAAGVHVTTDAVNAALADVRGQAAALPLLSSALGQAWRHLDGRSLTLASYRAGGTVRGALEEMAEDVFDRLDAAEQAAARRLLLRLVTRAGGQWTRRAVPIADAAPAADPAAAGALAALTTSRLVTVGSAAVELTHESLLAGWPRLRAWLEERALVAGQLERLAGAATTWQRDQRPSADLLRGSRLQAVLDWQDAHPEDLSVVENEFVAASRAAVSGELDRERRRRRRLTAASAGLAVVALVAGVVGVLAVAEDHQASAEATTADSQQLSAVSYAAQDLPTSLLLAAAAYRMQDTTSSRGALLSAIQRDGGALFRIPTAHRLLSVVAPADGSRVEVMDNTRTLLTFDPATRKLVRSSAVQALDIADLSPDGHLLVTCGQAPAETQTGHGRVVVLRDGAYVRTLPVLASELANGCGAFTRDGKHFVLMTVAADAAGREADTSRPPDQIAVFDTAAWSAAPALLTVASPVAALATGASTVAFQLTDGTVQVRRAADLGLVAGTRRADLAEASYVDGSLALSPDGRTLAVQAAAAAQTPKLLSTSDLAGVGQTGQGLGAPVSAESFSPDGKYLAAASTGGAVVVYLAADASTAVAPSGHTGSVTGLTWTGSGARLALYTVGLDSELVSWELNPLPRSVTVGAAIRAYDLGGLAPYGNRLVGTRVNAAGNGEDLVATDLTTKATTTLPLGMSPQDEIAWLAASDDGSRVAVTVRHADYSESYEVWDLVSGRKLYDAKVAWDDPILGLSAVLTDDGRQLIASLDRRRLEVVDVDTGRVLRTYEAPVGGTDQDTDVAPFSAHNGKVVLLVTHIAAPQPAAVPDETNTAQPTTNDLALLDPGSSTVTARVRVDGVPTALAWSKDGARVAVGTYDGTLSEYDAGTLEPVSDQVLAHAGAVGSLSYAPTGDMLVSGGSDGQVEFWDTRTLRRVGAPIDLGGAGEPFAWYQGDGKVYGFTPSSKTDPDADRWFEMPGTAAAWLADACSLAGRDLTTQEWSRYVGDQPYRRVCPAG